MAFTLKPRSPEHGGLGEYTARDFDDLGLGEYRDRFPEETRALTDEQIFHVVSHTDDDMSDDEWRAKFKEAST